MEARLGVRKATKSREGEAQGGASKVAKKGEVGEKITDGEQSKELRFWLVLLFGWCATL